MLVITPKLAKSKACKICGKHQLHGVGACPMRGEQRKAVRVQLDHKYPVNLMGVDDTWRRGCVLLDVSAAGAKLEVEGTTSVLRAKEFFLLLSSTGLAFRRCELAWIDGTHVGVRFISVVKKKVRASTSEMNGAERPQP